MGVPPAACVRTCLHARACYSPARVRAIAHWLVQAGTMTRGAGSKARVIPFGTCGVRTGTKYADTPAGACWCMCDDGMLLPPYEMPQAESLRMTLLNIIWCVLVLAGWVKG